MDKSSKQLHKIRHSLSHLMAESVLQLFPGAKLAIGPVIANGFYYDFALPRSLIPADLLKIEKRMKKLISQNTKFIKLEKTTDEAKQMSKDNPYKLELIDELIKDKQSITFYQSGKFIDLCAGPHVESTKEIKPDAFKLTKIAGAYWRGDEKNKMLQRIYGVAFSTKEDLNEHLKILKQAEERDHRKIGQEQKLFMMSEQVGPGLVLWMPKGARLRQIAEDFILDQYIKNGYEIVRTPHIGSDQLFSLSGHLDFYKDGMYSPLEIDKKKYYLKPMNCPFHVMVYQSDRRSYRDLPIRYTELGTVYRYERSGTLHGLLRVRGFTQDDGHIFCRPDQLEQEIVKALKLTKHVLQTFGFKQFKVALGVRDPKNKKKYMGKDASWDHAEAALAQGVKKIGWKIIRDEGEAVFYGPKVDIKVNDTIGREWQISTLQVDFNLPSRFKIFYTDKDSKKKEPFMLHRALLGSLERFIGILIENYAGAFPVWLSPVQVKVITVGKTHVKYAKKLHEQFKSQGIRSELDDANDTVGYKIRQAAKQKAPYMLVIGDKEIKGKSLNVRCRGQQQIKKMTITAFVNRVTKEIESKK